MLVAVIVGGNNACGPVTGTAIVWNRDAKALGELSNVPLPAPRMAGPEPRFHVDRERGFAVGVERAAAIALVPADLEPMNMLLEEVRDVAARHGLLGLVGWKQVLDADAKRPRKPPRLAAVRTQPSRFDPGHVGLGQIGLSGKFSLGPTAPLP